MADDKTSRVQLKAFFRAGDIPEERHFAALINSGINQADDGIKKSNATALAIQAALTDGDGGPQDLMWLYSTFPDSQGDNPNWRISLENGALHIHDGSNDGLFLREDPAAIDSLPVMVGIGTDAPEEVLHVAGNVKAESFMGIIRPEAGKQGGIRFADIDIPGPGDEINDNTFIRYYTGDSGLQSILEISVANTSSDYILLNPAGRVGIKKHAPAFELDVEGSIGLSGVIDLSANRSAPADHRLIKLSPDTGLGRDGNSLVYSANGNHSWRGLAGNAERMALSTAANGGLTVKGTGLSSIAGSLDIGRSQAGDGIKLQVAGAVKASRFHGMMRPASGGSKASPSGKEPEEGDFTDGILFERDPGGGLFDLAWLRYYGRPGEGEGTTFEIGVSNDANDHIALMPFRGNVGVGTIRPSEKLEVAGKVKAHAFTGMMQPTRGNTQNDGILFPKVPGGSGEGGWIRYYPRPGNQMTLAIGTNDNPEGYIALLPSGKVGIGTENPDPAHKLEVAGKVKAEEFSGMMRPSSGGSKPTTGGISPTEDKFTDGILFERDPGGGSFDLAWLRYYSRPGEVEGTTFEIGVSNDANDHIALMPRQGNVGIGTTTPAYKLEVNGLVKAEGFIGPFRPSGGNTEDDGILFPKDPGGGGGDRAWIRYYARSGESTTLEIGVSNDADDHIALMPSLGNVGIGTTAPAHKLEVAGNVKANAFMGLLRPTLGNTESSGILFPRDSGGSGWLRYYTRSGGRMALAIGTNGSADDHIALLPSGNVGIGADNPSQKLEVRGRIKADGLVGLSTIEPALKLEIKGAVKADLFEGMLRPSAGASKPTPGGISPTEDKFTDGILFERDPGGGSFDLAWLRYYARTGEVEGTTFEIGVSNDVGDHIALMPRQGNVGIGTITPTEKLEVNGIVKASAFKIGNTVITEGHLLALIRLAAGQAIAIGDFRVGHLNVGDIRLQVRV